MQDVVNLEDHLSWYLQIRKSGRIMLVQKKTSIEYSERLHRNISKKDEIKEIITLSEKRLTRTNEQKRSIKA